MVCVSPSLLRRRDISTDSDCNPAVTQRIVGTVDATCYGPSGLDATVHYEALTCRCSLPHACAALARENRPDLLRTASSDIVRLAATCASRAWWLWSLRPQVVPAVPASGVNPRGRSSVCRLNFAHPRDFESSLRMAAAASPLHARGV